MKAHTPYRCRVSAAYYIYIYSMTLCDHKVKYLYIASRRLTFWGTRTRGSRALPSRISLPTLKSRRLHWEPKLPKESTVWDLMGTHKNHRNSWELMGNAKGTFMITCGNASSVLSGSGQQKPAGRCPTDICIHTNRVDTRI